VTNSTFAANSAGNVGGAISNGGTLTVTNCTFSGNSSGEGGAIFNSCGETGGALCPVTLTNTIVANSTQGGNCAGTITDGGHNLDDGASCGFSPANGSLSNTNPQLDPVGLQNNGGPTQTVALCLEAGVPVGCTAASPAIDAGDDAVCAAAPVNNLDQRGFVRPGTGHTQCSIGAYEVDITACIGDCNATGSVTVDEILTLVNIALGTAQPSACPHGVPNGAEANVVLILQAVNHALNGCSTGMPFAATPTRTPTPTQVGFCGATQQTCTPTAQPNCGLYRLPCCPTPQRPCNGAGVFCNLAGVCDIIHI
ncbi:MAG TPA: choice-of-anchor Q domain-containing protein, partial [Candidatus Acidoferrales bacterium]|nr:choice-of-anchor Q domain-containing protein [Candidatus Acidoferrales bacterium]